jgi:hypothetical protein
MLERHISNLDNWAINLKGLIIFHRALQNILCKGLKTISSDVRALKTSEILKHYEYFEAMIVQIFDIFQHSNFCKTTRLFSNVIFMCFKDLIKIYKIYYVHITELLERFPTLNKDDASKGFIMY